MSHRRFNNGNKNLSRKGTNHCTAIDIWESANEIYYNGTYSDYQALSLYHRPSDRNNQALEGGHNGTCGACTIHNCPVLQNKCVKPANIQFLIF